MCRRIASVGYVVTKWNGPLHQANSAKWHKMNIRLGTIGWERGFTWNCAKD